MNAGNGHRSPTESYSQPTDRLPNHAIEEEVQDHANNKGMLLGQGPISYFGDGCGYFDC